MGGSIVRLFLPFYNFKSDKTNGLDSTDVGNGQYAPLYQGLPQAQPQQAPYYGSTGR